MGALVSFSRGGHACGIAGRAGLLARALAVAALACSAPACARVTVEQPDGGQLTRTHFGVLAIDAGAADGPGLLEIEAFGLSRIHDEVVLGYHAAQLARLPKGDCRIVVWIEAPGQARAVRDLLDDREDVCFAGASKGGDDEG